jgi:type I restriction-modification system DNA methylase subunit
MKLNTPTLAPEKFIERWQHATLSERASYQQHFGDVCHLIGAQTPIEADPTGEQYTFEYGLKKTDGRQGYADVFYRGYFAIEYKQRGKYNDLAAAYRQLQQYRENLNNPPLLIVCDIDNWEIHTNFTNAPVEVIRFKHEDLLKAYYRDIVRRMFSDPASFHPEMNKQQITEDVAAQFKDVVDDTLEWKQNPERVARFMTRLVFCMFAEDIGLLPKRAYEGILTEIVRMTRQRTDYRETFPTYVRELFQAMARGGNVQLVDIPYFNGSLFEVDDDDVIPLGHTAMSALDNATNRNWSYVEPTIFGTIFERTLDQKKRGQLGAHYTHPDDIKLIVEPVLMQPLRRAWATALAAAFPLREQLEKATNTAARMQVEADLLALRVQALDAVRQVRVLDPACGSGNFLYISLRLLLDLEKEIVTHPVWAGLRPERIAVNPTQLYGIETNEIAHALASVVVWIGYLQWRHENGYFETHEPILSRMTNNIRQMDAILSYDSQGKPIEPEWPEVDVIVGNPPFLGGRRLRLELDSSYVDNLRTLYQGRVTGSADLVTYWFEKARAHIESGKAKRAGLLSTNSIRNGRSRLVLDAIKKTGDIFMAWSDRPWVLDGAALRVSMVGFDDGSEREKLLNNQPVDAINADLTATVDITQPAILAENRGLCFLGVLKAGPFDLDAAQAEVMLAPTVINKSGKSNRDVLKRRLNGEDLTGRSQRNGWLIDFGMEMTEAQAAEYELPFAYVLKHVKPARLSSRNQTLKARWWLHGRPRPAMRTAIEPLRRYIATPEVAKYRVFVWVHVDTVPDHTLHVIAREDDYFFGVLHSRFHERWSLKIGSTLEDRPRYSSSRTFETFPFPFPPGTENFSDPRIIAISTAAEALHTERDAWLNAPLNSRERTLTNLYNALQYHRGQTDRKPKSVAADFALRLAELHDRLDQAVCAAYGWEASVLDNEDTLLMHLLMLNKARATSEGVG